MKRFATIFTSLTLVFAMGLSVPALSAATNSQSLCEGSGGKWEKDEGAPNGGVCKSPDGRTVAGTIQQIIDVLIFIIGAIAVLMVIIGGIRYVLSAGDQAATAAAKNTILYAIIGLVVAFTAFALVRFIYMAFNIK